jgi:hypothetical protein
MAQSGLIQRAVTLVGLFVVASIPAFPYMCSTVATPSEWYKIHHGQPTFVGVAVSVESVPDVLREGGGRPLLDDAGKTITVSVQKVMFRVEEPFEGIKNDVVEVYGWGTTNDYTFTAGTRYLVYAWLGEDGKIRTGKCTRTAPVGEAEDDLTFLRALQKRPQSN